MAEIKEMTALQINMIHQRLAEPMYKNAIDNEMQRHKDK